MPDDHQPLPPVVDVTTSSPECTDATLVAVGFTGRDGDYTLLRGAEETLTALSLDGFALLDRAQASGSAGETVVHQLLGQRSLSAGVQQVALIGLGEETPQDYRRAGAALARLASGLDAAATSMGSGADDDQLGAYCEGLVLGRFGFRRTSEQVKPPKATLLLLTDLGEPSRSAVIRSACARAQASWRARTFALTPSNEKGPVQLEQWAREAATKAELDIEIWDDARLAAEGFGGILAVGAESAYESRFVRLDYRPAKATRRTPPVVLVGKGITFDTGGLSLKPLDGMMTMKRDMTGAGVVIAVMGALRELGVSVPVTGLVASAENAFGGAAMRPGDVVTHYGGRTSEVGNTDAEGRLVLADALAYANAEIGPSVMVDIATLTGAGRVALGTSVGALFANDTALAEALAQAGDKAGEPVWRLPLSPEYESLLENPFADATNAAGGPGAITAALFLQHFAGDNLWAHLDIASVGDSTKDAYEYTLGATGFGARLLLHWLASLPGDRPSKSARRR